MKTLYIVHGLKRSGNHGIINWILGQREIPFFNNVVPVSPILAGKCALPTPIKFEDWLKGEEGSVLKRAMIKLGNSVMVSLEDHELDLELFTKGKYNVVNILILRDPRNLFSSRIRKASLVNLPAYPAGAGPLMERVVNLWVAHAKEFTGETSTLKNKACIYFNEWFANPAYRKEISSRLGLPFSDKGFRKVSSEGGGSSFDQTKFDGDNEKLKVLDRKSMLTENEQATLDQILCSAELSRLATKVEQSFKQS